MQPKRTIPLAIRFWAKVDRNGPIPAHCPELGPCWLWTGALDGPGYGKIALGRRGQGYAKASRVSWTLNVGPLADGANVLHKCDVRRCVRPGHLFLGTIPDNQRDMAAKGRSPHGERHHAAKLSSDDVRAIRERYAGGESAPSLARAFGVHQMTVYPILKRKTWRHVV